MSLEDEVRQLVIDGEARLRLADNAAPLKAALQPQYALYLRELSRSSRPKRARAEDYLRVVRAMREDDAYANLDRLPDADSPSLVARLGSPLHVLDAYLRRLPDAVVLMVETGTRVLTLFTLNGGNGPVEDRIALERASRECVDALIALMGRQNDDIASIARGDPVSDVLFDPIQEGSDATWSCMPETIRSALAAARTVLFLPSAFGDLGAFPLELLHTPQGWLGVTHSITRLSSFRTLFEFLSPNRMPMRFGDKALLVRAADSDDLTGADLEIDRVVERLGALGLSVDVERAPRIDSLRDALDEGLRILHYCGHGFAGRLGESLPLSCDESLGPHDFSQLTGWGTPFVYLSTCEVGRARMTTTGTAAGIAVRLIEKGAPGVVGCLVSVPERVAMAMAGAFYDASREHPAGVCLAKAREAIVGRAPPACWGAFVLFGDPNLRLGEPGSAPSGTRSLMRRWDSLVGRHLANPTPETRAAAADALSQCRSLGVMPEALLEEVARWLDSSFRNEEPAVMEQRLALCDRVAAEDLIAGCELRMLLAMEALRGCYFGAVTPDIVLLPEEAATGLFFAKAVHDTIAWSAFAVECGRGGGLGHDGPTLLRMYDQALGMLEGLAAGRARSDGHDVVAVHVKG